MSKKSFIDSIRVNEPCSQEWETMRGNDRVRLCDHCSKYVNNISSMTRKEAMKIVRSSGGKLCVRYHHDPNTGGPMFTLAIERLARQTGAAAGVLGATLLLANPAYTQDGGQVVQIERLDKKSNGGSSISGTVTDANGAVIPFAIVTLTYPETDAVSIQNTNEDGKYEFKDLLAGKYKIKIEANGFKAVTVLDIEVYDAANVQHDQQLEVATMNTTVDVELPSAEQYVTVGIVAMDLPIHKSNLLVQSVLNDDLDAVKEQLLKKPKVNVRDKSENGITPLHAAVQNGNFEMAKLLLGYGAKVDARDNQKRTPLMMIDYDATPELLDLLLAYGARFDLKDKRKNNVLHLAASNSVQDSVFERLLILGVDVNVVNKEGETPLMLAAENNSDSIVNMLLRAGARSDLLDKEKQSAWDRTNSPAVRASLSLYMADRSTEQ